MKTTLKLLMLLLGIFMSLCANAQSIEQLENEWKQSSGLLSVTKALQIADVYFQKANFEKAELFAERAFTDAKLQNETEYQAIALNRKAKAMVKMDKKGFFGKDKAIAVFKNSLTLLESKGNKNIALVLDNLEGLKQIFAKNNNYKDVAEIDARMNMLRGIAPTLPKNQASANLATENKKLLQSEVMALQLQNQALQQQNQVSGNQQLQLIKTSQNLSKTLENKELAIAAMTDTQLKSELLLMEQNKMVDSLANFSELSQMELANKEIALKEEKATRNLSLAVGAIVLLLAIVLLVAFFRQRFFTRLLEEKNKLIKEEKERGENLLLNILPSLVAAELKSKGFTEARQYDNVSVLFTDFVNFSSIAERLTARELVYELDYCFRAFDEIVHRNGLEKIKTIGDAYMCAGGLPEPNAFNAPNVVRAALEMRHFLENWNIERRKNKQLEFHARFGIHSGAVVAGVVGSKKFAFDIWGDTVNIAARMEAGSDTDKINISGDTYLLVKNEFSCVYRGKIAAKNKGEIDMYFVE